MEYDASRRAKEQLFSASLHEHERAGVSKVLDAAALTYVAALVSAVLNLLYYITLARNSREAKFTVNFLAERYKVLWLLWPWKKAKKRRTAKIKIKRRPPVPARASTIQAVVPAVPPSRAHPPAPVTPRDSSEGSVALRRRHGHQSSCAKLDR